ncbi:hypothetical protein HMN09_00851000 [Mycena chlorophos]|uniref:Uncharacterized protein n=1 Tax=Mycena chlorophos TaxID=658473 RepID=A0A8H6W4C8_MYCCL|nr:hypothetical protein HMN09_00851000 [Mycena chlorophos]
MRLASDTSCSVTDRCPVYREECKWRAVAADGSNQVRRQLCAVTQLLTIVLEQRRGRKCLWAPGSASHSTTGRSYGIGLGAGASPERAPVGEKDVRRVAGPGQLIWDVECAVDGVEIGLQPVEQCRARVEIGYAGNDGRRYGMVLDGVVGSEGAPVDGGIPAASRWRESDTNEPGMMVGSAGCGGKWVWEENGWSDAKGRGIVR